MVLARLRNGEGDLDRFLLLDMAGFERSPKLSPTCTDDDSGLDGFMSWCEVRFRFALGDMVTVGEIDGETWSS
jgi:hypothetical protein